MIIRANEPIPSVGNFVNKKIGNKKKTKATIFISVLKVSKTIVGLVFLISNFFIYKISKGRKSVRCLAAAIYP